MTGKLILVSGLSGAGKTTLIRYVVDNMPNLEYLRTTTTRPRRRDEDGSIEYRFVTDREYDSLQEDSLNWDHTVYKGYKYGADIDHVKHNLSLGLNIICSIAPDIDIIETMRDIYDTDPILLWVDTSALVARQRIASDSTRTARDEDKSVKKYFEHIFTPKNELDKDRRDFIALLCDLLK